MFDRFRKHNRRGAGPDCGKREKRACCPSESIMHTQECRVLSRVPQGCRCRIRGHKSCGAIRRRLLDMGFVTNAEVEMVRTATLGDPIELRLGNYYVALRKREAELIEVTETA